jgi:hypothetical protein
MDNSNSDIISLTMGYLDEIVEQTADECYIEIMNTVCLNCHFDGARYLPGSGISEKESKRLISTVVVGDPITV